MDERDVVDRLHRFGEQPIDPELSRQILTTMDGAPRSIPRRRTRMKVVGAAVAGFFVGSLGLASAGALPASLQDTAHSALDRIGVHVPPGHERYNDPIVCPEGPYRNHGEYVRTHKDDPNAGQSPCGKPTKAVDQSNGSDKSDSSESDDTDEAPGANGNSKDKNKAEDESSESADESLESDDLSEESTESSSAESSTESSDLSTSTESSGS
jgi:hypothetical protein